MKNVAIITEYNPFHKGHSIQIQKISELFGDDVRIIAIMSGNTVQRGEVALYDKYLRAECAIRLGVSAVFELPFPYSCSCAEIFARAGVHIANSLGNIDALVFGSECGDIDFLKTVSKNLRSKEYLTALEEYSFSNKSIPYPKRRETVYNALYGEGKFPVRSNDILGIEYISAVEDIGASIECVTYKREAGYTAKSTREEIRNKNTAAQLPPTCQLVFKDKPYTDIVKVGNLLMQAVNKEYGKKSTDIFDMPADLWARIRSTALSSRNFKEFTEMIKGAGYTDARIRRELLYLWCDVEKIDEYPIYTTLLGADSKGREFLGNIRKTKKIEILTKPADYTKMSEEAQKQFEKGRTSECLFAFSLTKPIAYADMMRKGPFMKKD